MESTSVDKLIEGLVNVKGGVQPSPNSPEKCPVFCCFYAEFDIETGPVVRYQSPKNFMEQDINISTTEIHKILANTFESYKDNEKVQRDEENEATASHTSNQPINQPINQKSSNSYHSTEVLSNTNAADSTKEQRDDKKSGFKVSNNKDGENPADDDICSVNINMPDGGQSFFDSTSQYIITGSELTGKIITLSTHDVHVMTRPTQITNDRYERNTLLFSIGMVLRRAADPRPFRPLISKLAMTLQSMEIESGILSDPTKVDLIIQPLLEQILITMNSPRWECNLLLNRSTVLNLKLFHPPKPPAPPVHDYHVPVLLVRDFQLGYYEWDLAINWVILHIDGLLTARQISAKAEVDLEMVLACLRVLRHHSVISVVDMFLYTNRYECTERAAAMLAGKEDKLLQEAVDFAVKRNQTAHVVPPSRSSPRTVPTNVGIATGSPRSGSPRSGSPYHSANASKLHRTSLSSSYPPRSVNLLGGGDGSQRSSNFRHAMMVASSLEREQTHFMEGSKRNLAGQKKLKTALVELYCACNRNLSFGDIWVALTTEAPTPTGVPDQNNREGDHRTANLSFTHSRSARTRNDSITDYDMSEKEALAFTPTESVYLESLLNRTGGADRGNDRSLSSSSTRSPMEWRKLFLEFDHRRFITFGVIHGLLIRVHSYPFFTGPFPERRRNFFHHSNTNLIPPESKRLHIKRETIEEKNFQLAKSIAATMDGTNLDDQIVGVFKKPFNTLVELVEKYSGKKVAHIYARGD